MQNSYGPGNHVDGDQAVAVMIMGDRSAFYDCRFLAYQDTVLDESGGITLETVTLKVPWMSYAEKENLFIR